MISRIYKTLNEMHKPCQGNPQGCTHVQEALSHGVEVLLCPGFLEDAQRLLDHETLDEFMEVLSVSIVSAYMAGRYAATKELTTPQKGGVQ